MQLKKGRICSSRLPSVPSETIWLIPAPAHQRHVYGPCRNFQLGAERSRLRDKYVLAPQFWYFCNAHKRAADQSIKDTIRFGLWPVGLVLAVKNISMIDQRSNDVRVKLALGGHLYASASSSADLCAPFLPVQTSFFLPPLLIREASRTLNLCFCITGLLCCFFSPPSVDRAFFRLTLLLFAVEIAPAEPTAASLSALLHSSSTKQQINSVATRGGGGCCIHPSSHFQTVAMETPLSVPT